MTQRRHGTYVTYVVDRCRCHPCTRAERTYRLNRTRAIAYGTWQPYVDAEPARRHTRTLMDFGIGWIRLAEIANIPRGSMSKLLYGDATRSMAPSKRIRPATAEKVLAIEPTLELLGAATPIDGTGTRRRLRALVVMGWPKAQLAARLGMPPSNFNRTFGTAQVYAGTARAVRDLYNALWDQDPRRHGVDNQAYSRACNAARTAGWMPPLAWDDDTIDDPTASPDLGFAVNRSAAIAEDARWLMRRQGYTREHAAQRLGITLSSLQHALRRVPEVAA